MPGKNMSEQRVSDCTVNEGSFPCIGMFSRGVPVPKPSLRLDERNKVRLRSSTGAFSVVGNDGAGSFEVPPNTTYEIDLNPRSTLPVLVVADTETVVQVVQEK